MKRFYILSIIIAISFGCQTSAPIMESGSFRITSSEVEDNFEIVVDLPDGYQTSKKYPLILYLDAGIKSGKKMPGLVRKKRKDAILVGVKHLGNYKVLRRRDFIPAHMKKKGTDYEYYSDDPKYGQAEKFHDFLKKELFPRLEQDYGIQKNNRCIIGHSFGGLFAVYACLKKDRLFDQYIAISPSLWTNYQNIWDFERAYHGKNDDLNARLFLAAGSLEIVNLVLHNTNIFYNHLVKRDYNQLQIEKEVFKGYSHNPVVDVAVPAGLDFMEQ